MHAQDLINSLICSKHNNTMSSSNEMFQNWLNFCEILWHFPYLAQIQNLARILDRTKIQYSPRIWYQSILICEVVVVAAVLLTVSDVIECRSKSRGQSLTLQWIGVRGCRCDPETWTVVHCWSSVSWLNICYSFMTRPSTHTDWSSSIFVPPLLVLVGL